MVAGATAQSSSGNPASSTTAVGSPTSGTWSAGQTFIDANGSIWCCSIGGTPGTWFAAGSGVELGAAELSTDFALSSTAVADVTGLTITFTAPARSFIIQANLGITTLGATGQYCVYTVTDSANVVLAQAYCQQGGALATVNADNTVMWSRLPRTGTGAYPITVGNSYTFKIRYAMSSVAGGNGAIATLTGAVRPILRAVTC